MKTHGRFAREVNQHLSLHSLTYTMSYYFQIWQSLKATSYICRILQSLSNSTGAFALAKPIITCSMDSSEQTSTHWGRVTHICVNNLTIIGSDIGLSPGRRQAIIWTNAGILLIGPLGTNFNEILIEIHTFSFKKMHLKMSYAKWRPFFSRPQCLNGIWINV